MRPAAGRAERRPAAGVAQAPQDKDSAMRATWKAGLAGMALLLAIAPPGTAAAVEVSKYQAAEGHRMLDGLGMTAAQLRGAPLHNEIGERIGRIKTALVSENGVIAGLGVEIGGMLGIGAKDILLHFDQVYREGDRIMTRLSEAQLEAQPRWDD
jgi:hypothetical protein